MSSRHRQRGYTLVEVLITVVIVGILATLATVGVRRYIFSAKTHEAIHMIGNIKTAQESFKDETFRYLSVSTNLNTPYPGAPGKVKYAWWNPSHANYAKWRMLGAETNAPVQYGYATIAGSGGTVPQPGTAKTMPWPTTSEQWYLVTARADLDGDGTKSIYVGSSFTAEIYSENDDE